MDRVRLSAILAIAFIGLFVNCDDFLDLQGPYCQQHNTCCNGRQDNCAVPISGTLCYCDDFCNSTEIGHDDCCPDYWSFCRGIRTTPQPFIPTTTRRPPNPDPLPLYRCMYKGVDHPLNTPFKDNCNTCECVLRYNTAEVECSHDLCLVTDDIINGINYEHNLGWSATNYTEFWGRKLQEGIDLRLGTIPPQDIVMHMQPVMKIYDPNLLPRHFDSIQKWPRFIHNVLDQGWCGSSWAISTASVASDRYAIVSKGKENVELSAQNILSCDRVNMRTRQTCSGGTLDRAWSFIKKYGLVDADCLQYRPEYQDCSVKRKGTLQSARCQNPPNPERKHRYKVGPAYKLRNETDIMYEIMESGPVQATLKIYHDFFSYQDGIYKATRYGLNDPYGYHSVKIVGWGEDNRRKYWKVANSWGPQWGENGYFRIARGSNECDIESFVLGVWPITEKEYHKRSYN